MEILDGFVCIVFCFLQNGSGLIVGIFQEFFFALINIFLLLLEFIAQLADFFFVALNLHLLLFQCDAAVFQFGDDVFKANIFGAQMFLCIFDEKIRKAEAGRDSKCITLSGNTNQKTVSRT